MLDTFVRSSAKQTGATEINYALFADETKETAAQTAEQSSAGTDASGTAGSTASSAQTGSQTAAETAGTTGAETKKRSAQTQQAYTDPLSEAYAAEESPAKSADTSASGSETAAPETETVTEPPVEFVNSDTVYQDENIRIAISEYTENDTAVYVADVQLSSAEYLKTAFANDTFGKNVTAKTSEIAAANNAILAVNGDFYGTHNSGYVIRNGILYRETDRANTDYLCIMADGSFFITTGAEYTAQELLDMGTWQCFMFGPRLIENGIINVDDNSEVARAMASNPRTAIGIVDELHYLFVVSDGRTSESDGLSLSQLAEFMQRLGAQTAYNLDGGGSSTMVFNGSLINNPTTSGRSIKERSVSDIVYIGY
ncbi:MAG TPA: hypothetical protein DCP68_07840 [Ruminococcus sp.]|nr:hypothetical protein [Ruminococcus sp.]